MDNLIRVKPVSKNQGKRDEAEALSAEIQAQYVTNMEKRPAPRVGKKALSAEIQAQHITNMEKRSAPRVGKKALQNESVQSAHEALAEYEIGSSSPGRSKGRRMMKEAYGMKKHLASDEATVDNATELRKRILSVSLFPNLYNSKMIHTESGSE